MQWDMSSTKPDSFSECLKYADSDVYPNIRALLLIGATLPISSAEAERSFSTLRRVKTYLRSTMNEERLTGLCLLNIHRDVKIDIPSIIEEFSKARPRRLFQGI